MSGLERLGERIAREQDLQRARSGARAEVRARLAAHDPAPPERPSRARYAAVLGAAALVFGAAIALWPRAAEPPALLMSMGTARTPVRAGTWVEAPAGTQALALSFSDGTRIDMAPHARLRVVELHAHGAHLMLESGRARVAVVPRTGAAWRLSAGPFAVRVIGTRFAIGWDPDADAFELDLEHGEVELSGCGFGHQYRMRTGHSVAASCRDGALNVKPRSAVIAEPVPAPAPAAEPAPAPADETVSATAEPPPASRAARTTRTRAAPAREAKPDWQPLAEQGNYSEAFERARTTGFAEALASADAEGLALLAQSARHAGASDSEAEALLLLRRRYAGTARAALAAFALGRLEFDKRQAYAKAAQWFGTYLKEQPRGTLVREARGRLIEATLAAGDRARARALAVSYLREHGDGPHAQLARSLVE